MWDTMHLVLDAFPESNDVLLKTVIQKRSKL